jgi:hypothetical protein
VHWTTEHAAIVSRFLQGRTISETSNFWYSLTRPL